MDNFYVPMQLFDWNKYTQCVRPSDSATYVANKIINPDVHFQLDKILAQARDAMPVHEFVILYEKIMGNAAFTDVMLNTLSACGIHIVS